MKETRVVENLSVEVRQEGDGPAEIRGTAVVYDAWSHDLGGFRERFAPGAFGNLSGADIIANAHHDTGSGTIGRTPDTLQLTNTRKQLDYRVQPADTTAARDLIAQIEAGIAAGSSFTFRVKAGGQEIEEDDNGNVTRTITDAELFEVSPVVNPAYPQTSVDMRSIDSWKAERDKERLNDEEAARKDRERRRELDLRKAQVAL